ncbi:DUF2628 domain-containing protein [Brucella tritici]|jgi:hypothetical protein|uniref:DUF2628 domain-containing protein n=1 Tax=Brucella tritici TaxID=94626 RepID=UPI003D6D95C3
MAQYVVLEPRDSKAISGKADTGFPSEIATEKSAEKAIFVRDGFHVLALVLPFVWLLTQRLWFEAFAVLGISILLGLAGAWFGIVDAVPLLTLLVSLFVALEGVNWKIAKLRRQGFVETAVIDASDLEEAEIRYFYGLEDAARPAAPLADKPAPEWAQQPPRPTYSSFGSTIGFVGHRGEN